MKNHSLGFGEPVYLSCWAHVKPLKVSAASSAFKSRNATRARIHCGSGYRKESQKPCRKATWKKLGHCWCDSSRRPTFRNQLYGGSQPGTNRTNSNHPDARGGLIMAHAAVLEIPKKSTE